MSWGEVKKINSNIAKALDILITEKFAEQNSLTSSKINEVNAKIKTRKAGMQKKTINGQSSISTIFSANGTGTFTLRGSKAGTSSSFTNIKVTVDGVPFITSGEINSGEGYKKLSLSDEGNIIFCLPEDANTMMFSFNNSIVFEASNINTELSIIFTYDYES